MGTREPDFAEFYRGSKDECLATVAVCVGGVDTLDLDTSQTAGVLGIASGTVQAHLGRAIAALRRDLQTETLQERPA